MAKRSPHKNASKKSNEGLFANNIMESIDEYIGQNISNGNTVEVGQKFCEWVLINVFELREDEVFDATEISGII